MEHQQLTSIEIENFTSIRSARVDLGPLNVLIGANGAGKSNLIQAFELLGHIGDGLLNLYTGLHGGASALINDGAEDPRITLTLTTPQHGYQVRVMTAANDELVFDHEVLFTHDNGLSRAWTGSLGRGHRESHLSTTSTDPIAKKAAARIADLLSGCRTFDFHDTSYASVKRTAPTADNRSLRTDAGNLAAVLLRLRNSDHSADKAAYRRIIGAIRLVAPYFGDFVLQPDNTDRILLRWRDLTSDTVHAGDQMSDGTLRFACLATLLLQPEPPKLILIDGPELGLHPFAIGQLADLLSSASTQSQILIATQSVTLLNHFTADDVIVAELRNGNSAFFRPNTAALQNWLAEYSIGELWEKNIIGGRPGSTGSVLDPPD
ncbi:chromosome segregation protein SMC [Amycolatopsis keratiniphila subsp. nogabecina]|nr:chromosome segregation protein SMC [Amycolatopsis keratiniphila subsp. nogabecina]